MSDLYGEISGKEFVAVPKEKFRELMDADLMLDCLQNAGVDNWDGYAVAMDEYKERKAREQAVPPRHV